MRQFLVLSFVWLFSGLVCGQTEDNYSLNIHRVSSPIVVDGILDEGTWEQAEKASNFYVSKPIDTSFARFQTEAMVAYDDNNLYVAAICYDDSPEGYIVQSLKRDFSFPRTDAFAVTLDPYNDGTNGFSFGVNPFGAQREGLLEVGGKYGVTTSWDNKWYSATKLYDDRWVVEMKIPFKTLRFNSGQTKWKVNFSRNDQKRNQMSAWMPVPRNFNIANLAYTGEMNWDTPTPKSGANVSLIPYVTTGVNRDIQNGEPTTGVLDAGFDAKIGITSSLNLDLTVNPDFSQVEVDRQVTNLERFELSFPERRQFFIENSDLFGNLGTSSANPFFSRRVGLARDSSSNLVENPILYGARLSGKINNDWRVGALNVQTLRNENLDIDAQNFSMGVVQRKLWARSNVTAFGINRQGVGSNGVSGINRDDYNRVFGAEMLYASKDGKIEVGGFYHQSMSPDSKGDEAMSGARIAYDERKLSANIEYTYVGQNYNAETGFVRRTGYYLLKPGLKYTMYPKTGVVNSHGPGVSMNQYFEVDFDQWERSSSVWYRADFTNTSYLTLKYTSTFLVLQNNFDPTRSGGETLSAGSDVAYNVWRLEGKTDERKMVFADFQSETGGYFNGKRSFFAASIRARFSPYGNFWLTGSVNKLDFPDPFNSPTFLLFGPKLEVIFNKNLFFTTFLQYNEQSNNININSRLQWRFKPASDLFVVYSENYLPEALDIKNRAIVLKLSYWFNL